MAVGEASSMERPTTSDKLQSVPFSVATNGTFTVAPNIQEIVADKGYHSNAVLASIDELGLRSYIAEPDRGRRRWKGKKDLQAIVYANRRRIRGNRGKRMQRQRGERLERPFAHQYETGGMRRLHLRGRSNVLKRVYIHACGCNLGLLMRELVGVGTPRSLQGRASAARNALAGQHGGVWPRLVALYRRIFLSWPANPIHLLSNIYRRRWSPVEPHI